MLFILSHPSRINLLAMKAQVANLENRDAILQSSYLGMRQVFPTSTLDRVRSVQ